MKKSAYVIAAVSLALMIALLVNPQRYAHAAYDGMLLYAVTIMPTMLPFFFLSGILTGTGIASRFSKTRTFPRLFNAPAVGAYVMLMACLSGYPVGAKLTAELYDAGVLDAEGARRLVPFTSATGPLFLLGTVGSGILHHYAAGWCILGAHYLSTILNGLLFRPRRSAADRAHVESVFVPDRLLWDAAYNTVISLFVAGVFIVCFNMFATILADVGGFLPLAYVLKAVGVQSQVATALGTGLVEMTGGCIGIANAQLNIKIAAPLCCLLVTGGGGCVAVQSIAYLARCGVKPRTYLLCKATQAVLAFGLCYLFCLLL